MHKCTLRPLCCFSFLFGTRALHEKNKETITQTKDSNATKKSKKKRKKNEQQQQDQQQQQKPKQLIVPTYPGSAEEDKKEERHAQKCECMHRHVAVSSILCFREKEARGDHPWKNLRKKTKIPLVVYREYTETEREMQLDT